MISISSSEVVFIQRRAAYSGIFLGKLENANSRKKQLETEGPGGCFAAHTGAHATNVTRFLQDTLKINAHTEDEVREHAPPICTFVTADRRKFAALVNTQG